MQFDVVHHTRYRYPTGISVAHHVARLTPRIHPHQHLVRHKLEIEPSPALLREREDYFGNRATYFAVEGIHQSLSLSASTRITISPPVLPSAASSPPWETVAFAFNGDGRGSWAETEFVQDSPLIRRNNDRADYGRESFPAGRPILDGVLALSHQIHSDFKFDPNATTVATPLDVVFRTRRGVCQDLAQILIGCLRSLDLPARYVSGYIETLAPPGMDRLRGADASHAWVSAFIPGSGWVDVDPTNNLLVCDRHVTVAWGRDYSDVSPLRGVVVGSGEHSLEVAVDVVRVGSP